MRTWEKDKKNSMKINEAAVRPENKKLMEMAKLIGYQWWKYLDEKFFGLPTNSIGHTGHRTANYEAERKCGRYVCYADFNARGYSNMKGFIVGFSLAKDSPNIMEAKIYSYVRETVNYSAVIREENIKDTRQSVKVPLMDVEKQYTRYAKVLAAKVNALAKREPKEA